MRPRMAPRKMTEERISRISASGTSQPVGAEASTTGGLGTYSASYTVTGGSTESISAAFCTSCRVPW